MNQKKTRANMRGYWLDLAAKQRGEREKSLAYPSTVNAPVQSPCNSPSGGKHDAPLMQAAEPRNLGAAIENFKNEDESTFLVKGD